MYYVYVLKGANQFYIGSTYNLRQRLMDHNNHKVFSTKNRGPWDLVYYEASRAEKDAHRREKYLKTAWGRRCLRNRMKHDK